MFDFLEDPSVFDIWSQWGGLETLLSYGIRSPLRASTYAKAQIATELREKLTSQQEFFSNLKLSFSFGDFFFVHAGVRPGVPLAQQEENDLLWIREEFLSSNQAFEKIIVHGHSPVVAPDVHANRINIDTGAYATGRLTCLVLQAQEQKFL